MYRDNSKPDEVKFTQVWLQAWGDFKNSLSQFNEYYPILGLLVALTGLFLGIEVENVFLSRIQSLLLFISILAISIFLLASLKVFYKEKRPEIYHAIAILFQTIIAVFIVNLFGYLFTNFSNEFEFFIKWFGAPLIGIFINLLCIYSFKLVRLYSDIEGWMLERYFLYTLNIHLVLTFIFADYNLFMALEKLIIPNFNNLFVVYLFFINIFSEIRPFTGRSFKSMIIETAIMALLVMIPLVCHYLIIPILF